MVDVKLSALAVKNIIEANDYVPIYDPDAAVGARNLLVPASALLDRAKHTGGLGGQKLTGVGHPTADQDATTLLYDQAKLMNLFANGSGLMGTNYNMSAMTFDPVETHGGAGSFRDTVATSTRFSDEFIPIDPEKYYRLVAWLKAGDTGGANFDAANRFSLGVVPYDIDGLSMLTYYYMRHTDATDTTLAVALNPGDTTMTLANATGWSNSTSAPTRAFSWWPYVNAKGFSYPNYTYSRNHSGAYQADWVTNGSWAVGGVAGNVITLRSAWTGPTLPVGTPVRNSSSGITYKQVAADNLLLPNAWTRYEGWIGGLDVGGTGNKNNFPYGLASVRVVLLANRSTTGPNTTRISDIWFSELSARNLELATPTSPGVMAAADKAKTDALGSTLVATIGSNVAIPASTVTQLATLTLTPGKWLLWGFANVLMGAAAGSVDVYLRSGTSSIAPPLTLQLAAAAQGGSDIPPAVVDIAANTTYNVAAFANAAATARATSGVASIAGATGLRAVRVG